VLTARLRDALPRINLSIPEDAREQAPRMPLRLDAPALTQTNRAFHRLLRDGVPMAYPQQDSNIAGDYVQLVDFNEINANDWLVVNQFTVIEGQHNRRPDIVTFVNGLPLGLLELKNAADEDASIWNASGPWSTLSCHHRGCS